MMFHLLLAITLQRRLYHSSQFNPRNNVWPCRLRRRRQILPQGDLLSMTYLLHHRLQRLLLLGNLKPYLSILLARGSHKSQDLLPAFDPSIAIGKGTQPGVPTNGDLRHGKSGITKIATSTTGTHAQARGEVAEAARKEGKEVGKEVVASELRAVGNRWRTAHRSLPSSHTSLFQHSSLCVMRDMYFILSLWNQSFTSHHSSLLVCTLVSWGPGR